MWLTFKPFHRLAEQRRGHLAGFAHNDPGAPDLLAVVHDGQGVVGHVDHHMVVAKIAREPAPALHIRYQRAGNVRSPALSVGFALGL